MASVVMASVVLAGVGGPASGAARGETTDAGLAATDRVIVELIDLDMPRDADVLAGLLDVAHTGIDATAVVDGLDVMEATVTAEGRAALEGSGLVESVRSPYELELLLDVSTVTIEAAALHAEGRTGAGTVVAVIDSGVDVDHPALEGSVVSEACFLTGAGNVPGTTLRELCGNGSTQADLTAVGPGTAEPCTLLPEHCTHGTHVAGVVSSDDETFTGVAPDAGILAIRVGAILDNGSSDINYIPELGVLAALDHVYELRDTLDIAAVNLSLGGDPTICDGPTPTWDEAISKLTEAGIAVVAASGNGSSTSSIAFPACHQGVISVGASGDDGEVAEFSDTGDRLDLLAPGQSIDSTVLAAHDPSGYAALTGTSFAAPHVAAAIALADAARTGADPTRIRDLMRATGEMITRVTPDPDDRDPRFPEIRLVDVVEFVPFPDATSGFWVNASDWARYTGVSTGIGGKFLPDLELTRAQAVTFLWRFMGSPPSPAPSGFADVAPGAWYEDAVDWAADVGVTTGVSPARFAPDDPVDRAQLATFMWRTAGEPSTVAGGEFIDVPAGAYYEAAVDWMAVHEITTGTTPTTFSPLQVVSRAQMVTFEHRLADADGAWTGSVAPPDLVLF